MASPQISKDVQSSDEFGYLNAVVGDATNTIYEAESWAVGTRGSIAVASASSFDITCAPSGEAYITSASAIQSKFMDAVGDAPGLKRVYTFTYVADANWWLECESINGPTVSKSDQELVNNIAENYGITYSPDEIDADNKILVTIEEPDPAYENNAKYYMELSAAAASSAIETLENCVKATPSQGLTDTQKANARANIDAIGEPSEKSVGQFLSYGSNGWVASDGIKDPVEKVAGQFLTYGSDGWAASTIDYIADPSEKLTGQVLAYDGTNWSAATKSALDFNAIPITLTSYFYGNELPGDPVQGRLFFLKSGTEVT